MTGDRTITGRCLACGNVWVEPRDGSEPPEAAELIVAACVDCADWDGGVYLSHHGAVVGAVE